MQDTDPSDSIDLSIRAISARLGVLGRADGSCQWSQGDTSVLVAVWGPSAPKRGSNALPDRAFIDIRIIEDINDNVNQNSNLHERDNPISLKQHLFTVFKSVILDALHPRCQISIVVQVIADDGSLLSCCINGITMALIDAGIAMSGFISASTAAINDPTIIDSTEGSQQGPQEEFILDPNAEQSKNARALLTLAWNQKGKQVLNWYQYMYEKDIINKPIKQQFDLWNATDASKKVAAKILNFQRQTIKQKVIYEASAASTSNNIDAKK